MRHVISYTFPITLFCGLSQLVSTLPQESLLWSDPQLSSEEWHPFVPPNYPGLGERTLQTYPRTETIRQYFGKTPVEPAIQNSAPIQQSPVLKKSFQAQSAATNNVVDQYAIAPVVSTFNSFGVQTVQTRNPVFEKNIKDGHLLEQPTQYQFKYQPFPQQQVSTSVHRFPSYFSQSTFDHFPRQPAAVNVQQASFHGHAAPALAGSRYENALKQAPSRSPVATTIQVFPPPPPLQSASVPHNQQFGQNTFYLNVPPPPKEEYSVNESLLDRKQTRPSEYHQSFNMYHTRDENSPKNVAQQQSSQSAFFENVRTPATEKYEYEIVGNSRPASYQTIFGNEHTRGGAAFLRPNTEVKKPVEELNPSKQVYEQLSPLGRPFTLSKDGRETESESLGSYGSVSRPPSKKTKNKASQSHSNPVSITYHRVPGFNGIESLVDYESGKLQTVKTVNYFPQRESNRFGEEDQLGNNALLYHPTSEKQPMQNSFLPTPTDTNENDDTRPADPASSLSYTYHHNRFTTTTSSTTAAPIFDESSQLPHNHKYSPANLRHRRPETTVWRQPAPSSEGSKHAFPLPEGYEESKTSYDNAEYEPTTTVPTSTTRRNTHTRRRKPSKLKNKNRTNVMVEEGETSSSSLSTTEENYPRPGSSNTYEQPTTKVRYSYYDAEENRNTYADTNEAINTAYSSEETPTTSIPTPTTQNYPVKKKHFKIRTTTVAPEEEYPNYPLEYFNQQQQQQQQQQVQQQHPHQQQEQTNEPYVTESTDNVKQEEQREISKANYPTVSKPKVKPNFAASLRPTVPSSTTTEGTTASTSSSIQKVRTRTRAPATVTSSPVSGGVNLTRPRFSIKDYKRTTTTSPGSTATPSAAGNDGESAVNENNVEVEKKVTRKNLYALRNKNRVTSDSDVGNDGSKPVTENSANEEEPTIRKYKPRVRPANKYSYKISTPSTTTISSSSAITEATAERVNTFRPSSGGRIRSSTSKYYNRYRTTTEVSKNSLANDDDDDRRPSGSGSTHEDHVQASSSNIKPTRTLLFSAKKSTTAVVGTSTAPGTISPNLNKVVEYEDDEDDDLVDDEYEDESEEDRVLPPASKPSHSEVGSKTKKHHFHKKPTGASPTANLEKADDISGTSIMTSSEEEAEKKQRHHKSGAANRNSTQPYRPQTDKSDQELDLSMVTMDGKDGEVDEESESVMYRKTDDELVTSTVSSTSTSSNTNTESATVPMTTTTTTTLLPEEQHESEDDVNERVSKISMLTSQDESNRVHGVAVNSNAGASSYKHHWRFPFFAIKKISDSDY